MDVDLERFFDRVDFDVLMARGRIRELGIPDRNAREWATSSRGYWRIAGSPVLQVLPNEHWKDLGLIGLRETWHRLKTTA
ncbi:hypothetical protein [Actinoallomurus soli]|uniref:hypothetical protein n=1 Tax=Actinoallomurus soli TaxID=2952535 RepID=UPI002091EB6F|nr:hypothetical protein [Actinoallomurus soli]MCO5970995.1 hypothetical protein [Actinoallomurus soli]